MERLSDRHEGDLDGRLRLIDHVDEAAVAVVVAPETARLSETQHAAWMLTNILVRALACGETRQGLLPGRGPVGGTDRPPGGPRPKAGGRTHLRRPGCRSGTRHGRVARTGQRGADRRGYAAGRHVRPSRSWARLVGGVGDRPIELASAPSDLPFGPYIAAALAAAEVFLDVRLPAAAERRAAFYGWDCWTSPLAVHPDKLAPAALRNLDLTGTALASAGTVGAAWVHTTWATPGLIGDVPLAEADAKSITTSNLNRCALFGHASLSRAKADVAAKLAADSTITWHPHHGRLEELPDHPALLISAVDTNQAREALQHRYSSRILSGSTRDLRAEILRIGPPGRRRLPPLLQPARVLTGDDDLRARTRSSSRAAIADLATTARAPIDEVIRWLHQGSCDDVGTRLLRTVHAAERTLAGQSDRR
ncbi:hypothetical protein ILP97_00945 [Amycolatopsis sp. H6(2020)]|nr:hypothetical protein [Amycolatopsis sp. H6(2020)]